MTHVTDATPRRVVIVGAGFAGMHAARRLARLAGHQVEVTLINPTGPDPLPQTGPRQRGPSATHTGEGTW